MAETPEKLPSGAAEVAAAYPQVWEAYAALGKACSEAGPIEGSSARLIKLARSEPIRKAPCTRTRAARSRRGSRRRN